MYHPSRGGVRGGRDQFSWEDVKADKHRENYLGHSLKAPVGRWQKGKDLRWYARDKKSEATNSEAIKEEIQRIKEEEEQAMREALGLAPKRAKKSQGNRLDKHEFAELVKRGSTAEDLGAGHAEAAQVQGLGSSRVPRPWEESSLPANLESESLEKMNNSMLITPARNDEEQSEDESNRKRGEKKREKHEKPRASDDSKGKHNKEKEKRTRFRLMKLN
ncbi:multiple myeloma tumor-associated protein 2 homolog [Olea europaea var. sylvestris]|uniref:multiple myeloma tumor-associated protein 2 homolog n=1 Tax=Olea europaea var. sylvestris TaxID=158386 RepID=UPI000C1CE1D7|nr:multiple myeloma tumor-associated protein 2 homolog [Olea europaea var. sylvestris]